MSPVLLCNSHILWMCYVARVFVKCILFILSEINPWILICFIGMQFPYQEMQMQMSQRKKIKTHRWIWKFLIKIKWFSDTKSVGSNGHLVGLSCLFLMMLLWLSLSIPNIWDLIVTLILFTQINIIWQLQYICVHLYQLTHSSYWFIKRIF